MSKESLSAFLKMVAEDEDFQSKLVEFAASHGFKFTEGELSDADLDGVAGGGSSSIFDGKVNKSGSLFPDVGNTPPASGSIPVPSPNQSGVDGTPGLDGTPGSDRNTGTTSPGGT